MISLLFHNLPLLAQTLDYSIENAVHKLPTVRCAEVFGQLNILVHRNIDWYAREIFDFGESCAHDDAIHECYAATVPTLAAHILVDEFVVFGSLLHCQ